ncbi:hypothetical protein [Roseomonas sp. KE2513]|uniref:hypothetical protein n=1 Tax=Roseomonas sp. KE2513 TaxID=2479202 RepID=UPI0018DFDB99|nr:hypothetical protein [Roseomonas sp. KE2513]
MAMRADELISVIRGRGETMGQIAQIAKKSERHVRDVSTGKIVPRNETELERNLGHRAKELIKLPWCSDALEQMIIIRELYREKKFIELEQTFEFSSRSMLVDIHKHDALTAIEPSQELWGKALIVFYYVFAMRNSNKKSQQSKYSTNDWSSIVSVLAKLLNAVPDQEQAWVTILRYKINQLRLADKWNSLSPSERTSADMQEWLEKTDMRKQLLAYNQMVPHVFEAPFAALAIASRFGERSDYPAILARLQAIDSRFMTFESIENIQYEYFDDDFADFRAWAKQELCTIPNGRAA